MSLGVLDALTGASERIVEGMDRDRIIVMRMRVRMVLLCSGNRSVRFHSPPSGRYC